MAILIAESNKLLQWVLKNRAELFDDEVDVTGSGYKAVFMAHEKKYDLILLSIELSDLSGLDVCQRIRYGVNSKTGIIGLSTDKSRNEIRCLHAGFNTVYDTANALLDLGQILNMFTKKAHYARR